MAAQVLLRAVSHFNEEDKHSHEQERLWNEAQKRYLEYFKQMTVLNTASMGVLVALGGQTGQNFLVIPLVGIAISLLGFVFSLLASMVGMFLVVEAPYFRVEQQRKLARAVHGFSALAFMVGVLVAVVAAMYIRLGAEYWIWILTLYLVAVVLVITKFRSAILPVVDSMALVTEVLASSFTLVSDSIEYLFSLIKELVSSLGSVVSRLANRIIQFFRRS